MKPEELLFDICVSLGMTYSDSSEFKKALIKRIEELISIEADYMEESDYKEKYENLVDVIANIGYELHKLSSEIDNAVLERDDDI